MKETLTDWWEAVIMFFERVNEIISSPLFELSNSKISLGTILYVLMAFVVLSWISKKVRRLLVDGLLKRANFERSLSATIGTVTRFSILLIGSVVIIQSAGIDLSALSLLAGALGVGIGFGLQNITDNFISGIIILFEKPIKVGDRIALSDVEGDVVSISVRATTVQTNDNISVIVPNSQFISDQVINWSHNDRNIRFRIPVGVSYNDDPIVVREILMKVAADNVNVLKDPPPRVFFDGFGDSSLDFTLAVWTTTMTDKPRILKSELYFEIFKRFKEQGIEIPFPQRDVHIKNQ